MKNPKIDINSGDEIIIVVPPEAVEDGELEIDLDELGIDIESLDDDVNIVIEVDGADIDEDGLFDDDEDELEDFLKEPNEWYFDDDPYGIVYYEFPDEEDWE